MILNVLFLITTYLFKKKRDREKERGGINDCADVCTLLVYGNVSDSICVSQAECC